MYLNIKILEDFRTLKAGDEFNFVFSKEDNRVIIVGKNGCGKSTLVNILRDFKCDNKTDNYQYKLGYIDIRGLSKKAEVSTNFKNFYFISSEFDDPNALNNSATAEAMATNGGYAWRRISNGQRSLQTVGKWLEENKNLWNEESLLIFDEADKGFDLKLQIGMNNLFQNISNTYGVSILAISHHLFPVLLEQQVYWFECKKTIPTNSYIKVITGYDITINKSKQ